MANQQRFSKLCHLCLASVLLLFLSVAKADSSRYYEYRVDPLQQNLAFYWRDSSGKPYQTFQNLQRQLSKQNKQVVFAINGGIFQQDLKPLGLFVEQGEIKYRLSRRQNGYGNFYIQPNGIFYLSKQGKAFISQTKQFHMNGSIDYATQSGPLLLIDGEINPNLNRGSINLRIRNGVCVLADGMVLFAMSKYFVNFYDFATYFKQQGCHNALYLDGSVSRIYHPSQGIEMDGRFGPIIAETKTVN